MRRLIIALPLLALAACNKAETPAPAETTAAATPTVAASMDSAAMVGSYEIKNADGTVVSETINADGTFVDTRDGTEVQRGKWRADGARTCFDPDGADPEMCFTTSQPSADGSFKVIGPDGKETGAIVRKVG